MVAAHRLFAPPPQQHGAEAVELDEAEVIWGTSSASSSPVEAYLRGGGAPPTHVAVASSKGGKGKRGGGGGAGAREGGGGGGGGAVAAASLPVNIPDWSKILGTEYGGRGSAGAAAARWPSDERGGDEECRGGLGWVPPHELLLCRERAAASFSVREGAGRTLKGRDLRRVRNAVLRRTGFLD